MKSDYDSKEKVHKRAEEILGIPFGELAKDVNSKKDQEQCWRSL
ncbi:hypothetical protein [Secundilactobacillus collinoides]|nr:hypothetical protein [Secundilactobacillus collinoides]